VSFAKGELVFARGDTGTRLYLVADGRMRLAIATSEGRELSFRHASKATCSVSSPRSTAARGARTPPR
jgi:CRP-like cAMP-binding protein